MKKQPKIKPGSLFLAPWYRTGGQRELVVYTGKYYLYTRIGQFQEQDYQYKMLVLSNYQTWYVTDLNTLVLISE